MQEPDSRHQLLHVAPYQAASLRLVWVPPLLLVLASLPLWVDEWNRTAFLWLHHGGWYLPPALWESLTVLGDGLAVAAIITLIYPENHPDSPLQSA